MATKKTLGSMKIDHNMVDHKANEMMKFWFTYKDYEWNPYFLPDDGWGYYQNPKHLGTTESFLNSFRNYMNQK